VATVERCVDEAEAGRRACFQDCEGWFEEAFIDCYRERCATRFRTCLDGCLALR
jgi:hypothetical protein